MADLTLGETETAPGRRVRCSRQEKPHAGVPGRGDTPNQHDILTGSTAAGTSNGNHCSNWTSSATSGTTAQVGHFDRMGGGADPTSWSSAHATNGCSAAALVPTGGRGSIYCFAGELT